MKSYMITIPLCALCIGFSFYSYENVHKMADIVKEQQKMYSGQIQQQRNTIAELKDSLAAYHVPIIEQENEEGQHSSIKGESDSTIIGTSNWYGETVSTRYYFRPENYSEASNYIQMANIPYQGLNDAAQKEMSNLAKYIIKTEYVK